MLLNYEKLVSLEQDLIYQITKDAYADEMESFGSNSILTHYTASENLPKILRENGIVLRFSAVEGMNDSREGKVTESIYKSVCEELLKEAKINQQFCKLAIEIEADGKTLFLEPDPDKKPHCLGLATQLERAVYLCCFSRKPNSDYMWQTYIKNEKREGYSLGFRKMDLGQAAIVYTADDGKTILNRSQNVEFQVIPVVYRDDLKKSYMETLILTVYDCWEKGGISDHEVQVVIGGILNTLQYVFKEPQYADEEEVRVLLYIPEEQKHQGTDGQQIQHFEVMLGCCSAREAVDPTKAEFELTPERSAQSKSALLQIIKSPTLAEKKNSEEDIEKLKGRGYRFQEVNAKEERS